MLDSIATGLNTTIPDFSAVSAPNRAQLPSSATRLFPYRPGNDTSNGIGIDYHHLPHIANLDTSLDSFQKQGPFRSIIILSNSTSVLVVVFLLRASCTTCTSSRFLKIALLHDRIVRNLATDIWLPVHVVSFGISLRSRLLSVSCLKIV